MKITKANIGTCVQKWTKEYIKQMKKENTPIEIKLENEKIHYIYYSNSEIYYLLRYYPAVQFLFIGLFILSAYWIFSSYRKAEQNNVWAGMAKETAHQLGTPISSLMAWVEYLKIKEVDSSILTEIDKDIVRLQVVADRFSKIGSVPELQLNHLMETIAETVNYMQKRCSSSIHINFINHCNTTHIFFNKVLLEWVIENIIRNAIDSLEKGKGNITVNTTENAHQVIVDITDTGKGIPSHKLKTIFEPGYTTKKRGWGLGLSLSKRIIEKFHNGKIFVKQSELNKGTTFRIVLNKPI